MVDLQSGERHAGGRWLTLASARAGDHPWSRGAVLPTAAPAAHTGAMDFDSIELWVLGTSEITHGLFCATDSSEPQPIEVRAQWGSPALVSDPTQGRVKWTIRRLGAD